jgi:hypothetical protein
MKFLIDQDVYFATIRFLEASGHDVVTASDINCSRAPRCGVTENRTRDESDICYTG